MTGAEVLSPWAGLYLQIKAKRGLGMLKVKKRLQCFTKGSLGDFWESTWVPKATLATMSVV